MPRRYAWMIVLLVVALPYLAGLRHGFVYDDHGTIEENAFLDDPANAWKAITLQTLRDPGVMDGQRPVLILTHFIERAAWGLRPPGYHATNLLLHLLVVILVLVLARRLGAKAYLVALLFGLHPVLIEVVQVPSFREDLLVAAFGLGYLLTSSTPLLILALLSKESAVVLPFLLAWYWFCFPDKRPDRRRMTIIFGVGLAIVAAYLFTVHSGRGLQAAAGIKNGYSLEFPGNLLGAPCLFLEYLRLLLVPWPLCADRAFLPPSSVFDLRFGIGVLGGLVTLALAFMLRRSKPQVAFGLGWLLIAFVPISNLIPLFNPMADRYLYLVAVGFALMLSSVIRPLSSVVICAFYAVLIFARLPDWRDDYTLWTKTGQQEPASARAHTWVGLEMKERGHRDVAARHFSDADKINPQDVTALINLAILDGERGDLAEAESKLREAVRRRPDKSEAYDNLATALHLQGKDREAEVFRQEAERRSK